jgi:hypothetical protein
MATATDKPAASTTAATEPEPSSFDQLEEERVAREADQAKANEEEAKDLEAVLAAAESLPSGEPRATIETVVHQRQAALGVDRSDDDVVLNNPQTWVQSPSAVATGEETGPGAAKN